jgi:chaperonin GroES
MKLKPLNDRILVKRRDEDEKTAGGILVPDSAKEKPQQGDVVAVGPGARLDNGDVRPMAVQAGDRVLFGKYAGSEVKVDGEEYVIMREEDVLAVVEG